MITTSKILPLSLLATGALISLSSTFYPALANSMMFQANLERTGVYDDIGPEDPPKLIWKFDAGAPIFSTPLVYDEIVYFVDFEGGIYAANQSNGSLIWRKDLSA